jgi:hypothetical protein
MFENTIELNKRQSSEQKRASQRTNSTSREICKVPVERVVITIHETKLENKTVAGVLLADHLAPA